MDVVGEEVLNETRACSPTISTTKKGKIVFKFKKRPRSFRDFTETLLIEDCQSVTITLVRRLRARALSPRAIWDIFTTFKYYLVFSSHSSGGRRIIFKEYLFERFEGDVSEMGKGNVLALLLAEERSQELREKVPDLNVHIISPDGQMNEEALKQLHRAAKKLGFV